MIRRKIRYYITFLRIIHSGMKNPQKKYLLPLLRDSEDSLFIQNYAVYYVLNRFLCNLDNRNKKQLLGKKFDKYLEVVKEIFGFVDDYYLDESGSA